MDGNPNDVELLLSSARQEIASLEGDPRFKPFDGKRGEALRDHVLDLIGAAEHRLALDPGTGAPPSVSQSFSRTLRESILMLRAAHAAMPWLAATRSPSVNLGSLYATEECAEILVGKEVDLVVVPDVEFMYSTISWPFLPVTNDTPGFTPRTTRRPIILHYPLSDGDRLLLHPLFAHELGHAAAQQFALVDKVNSALAEDSEFVGALTKAVELMKGTWTVSEVKVTGTILAWLRDWIEELLCDQMAVEVMGPAYLWAFAGFVLPLGYHDKHPAYPPVTVRIRLMLDLLLARGWQPYMEEAAPHISSWLIEVGEDAEQPLSQPYEFLRQQILNASDLLRDTVAAQVGGGTLSPVTAVEEAREASTLLKSLILPVGESYPLEPRSIMLGGWQEAVRAHEDRPEGLVAALSDRRLQDLVGKAMEMSVVSSSWRKP